VAATGIGPLDRRVIPVEVRPEIGRLRRLAARDPISAGSGGGRFPGASWADYPSRGIVGAIAKGSPKQDRVTVILPPEPRALTPEAARILPRILVEASEKQAADNAHSGVGDEQQPGDH